MKPFLVYLHDGPIIESLKIWPELSDAHTVDISDVGAMPTSGFAVVSIPEGSDVALSALNECRLDVGCVSVRHSPGAWYGWWVRLEEIARRIGSHTAMHDRHDVCEVLAHRAFNIALRHLDDAVDLVRADGIHASPEAMKTEKSITKAIELLKATGFRAPRSR